MLVIEALQALAMKAKDIGMISSFEVSADKLVVTHFQYAGDTHFQKKKKICGRYRLIQFCEKWRGCNIEKDLEMFPLIHGFED